MLEKKWRRKTLHYFMLSLISLRGDFSIIKHIFIFYLIFFFKILLIIFFYFTIFQKLKKKKKMTSSTEQFSLRWNNYLSHITFALDSLRTQEDLVDVTLSCEGKKIRAHKVLLSACSSYFRDIFKENPCQHPVIIFKNVKYDDLFAIIEFMYQGEVNVVQDSLPSFLNTAELLSVQGLTDRPTAADTKPNAFKKNDNHTTATSTTTTTTTTKTSQKISLPSSSTSSISSHSISIESQAKRVKLSESIGQQNKSADMIDEDMGEEGDEEEEEDQELGKNFVY